MPYPRGTHMMRVHVEPASLLSFFSIFSLSPIFSLFFLVSFQQRRTNTILGMQGLLKGAYRSPPHLCFYFFYMAPRAKCARPVSPTERVTSPRVQFVLLGHSMILVLLISILKMVSDQKYPRVHIIQTTCSCFY